MSKVSCCIFLIVIMPIGNSEGKESDNDDDDNKSDSRSKFPVLQQPPVLRGRNRYQCNNTIWDKYMGIKKKKNVRKISTITLVIMDNLLLVYLLENKRAYIMLSVRSDTAADSNIAVR